MADDVLVDTHLPTELVERRIGTAELEEVVVALTVVIDLIGKPALAPGFQGRHLTAVADDDLYIFLRLIPQPFVGTPGAK